LTSVVVQLDAASTTTRRHLVEHAKRVLELPGKAAGKAAKGRKPKLTKEFAAAISVQPAPWAAHSNCSAALRVATVTLAIVVSSRTVLVGETPSQRNLIRRVIPARRLAFFGQLLVSGMAGAWSG